MIFDNRYFKFLLLILSSIYSAYGQQVQLSKGRSITHLVNESSFPYGVSASDSGWVLLASSKKISVHSPNLTEVLGQSPEDLFQRSHIFSVRCGYYSAGNLFILAALVSNENRPTELAIAYFKMNSTHNNWTSYYYSTDLENNNTNLQHLDFAVYAQEAILTAEVIDTSGNLLKNAVLQMSLTNIEQSKPSYLNWKNLPTFFIGTPGLLCPVKSQNTPPYYIISTQKASFFQIFMYSISDTLGGAAEITASGFSIPTYYEPQPFQPNGSPLLTCGDTRIRDAYLQDSFLYFTYTSQNNGFSSAIFTKLNLNNAQVEILNQQDTLERSCFSAIAPLLESGNWIGNVISQKKYPNSGFGYSEAYSITANSVISDAIQLKASTEIPDNADWGSVSQIVSTSNNTSWALTSFHKNNKLQTTVIELISQTTSRNTPNNTQHITVFPNPASCNVSINLQSCPTPIEYILVQNISGNIIFKTDIKSNTDLNIDISNWEKGMYFIDVKFVNGNNVYEKLAIQ